MYNDQLQKRELVTQSLQKGKLHLNVLATQRPAEGRSYWNKLLVTRLAPRHHVIRYKRKKVCCAACLMVKCPPVALLP